MNGERHENWQEKQLRQFMAEHENEAWSEHLSVKLSNPDEEHEIDEVILQELWPGVVRALRGSRPTTWTGGKNTPAEGLETLHHQYTTRSLTRRPGHRAGPRSVLHPAAEAIEGRDTDPHYGPSGVAVVLPGLSLRQGLC